MKFKVGDRVFHKNLEGRKRIYAINAFIDGKIKFSNKYYTELSKEEFDIFNNYELGIFVG